MSLKRMKLLLVGCLVQFVSLFQAYAIDPYSKNIGFESGTFTGWSGYNWRYSSVSDNSYINTSPAVVNLPTSRRQVIMTDTTAYDPNTGNALKIIPKGYRYSARLGDMITKDDQSPRCWEQSLRYSMKVDSTNALLVMKFACVLQYASDHTSIMEPRFRLSLYDQNGASINDCANYDVYSSSGNVTGFQSYTPSGSQNPNKWRDWTAVGANLLNYRGQTITLEFMTADCTKNFHYGYAYFVAETHPMFISVQYCSGDTHATLTAPEGFSSYSWVDSTGVVISSAQSLTLAEPVEGATYTCNLVSATGCPVSLTSVIEKYQPDARFSHDLLDCNDTTNTMKFHNLIAPIHGALNYKWDFDDGTSSSEQSPTHTFRTSGLHQVSLVVRNPPSLCTDSVSQMVETFYPPLIGITGDSTYCPGYTTTLKAHGAYRYQWSNRTTDGDSIVVGRDTTSWMIGYSSIGCHTDTIKFKVSAQPDWPFTAEGKEVFCQGDSTILTASEAVAYSWNTGQQTRSITVKTPGPYTVTGSNARGCQKSVSFNVKEDLPPNVDFTVSSPSVDSRHNQLSCSIPQQDGVVYSWSMGDGTTETGAAIHHTYAVSNSGYEYPITLTATNTNGCINSATKSIDIVLFVSNVFTPNGDGVNDTFMPGVDLQVFDRYGLLLYKGNTGWNGYYNDKMMDQDTYFYLINYTGKNQKKQLFKGYFTLKK